jgi:hypothetical protein
VHLRTRPGGRLEVKLDLDLPAREAFPLVLRLLELIEPPAEACVPGTAHNQAEQSST